MTDLDNRFRTAVVQFDYLLLLFVLLTTGFGLIVLYGSTHEGVAEWESYTGQQAMWWVVALVVFAVAVAVPYRWLKALGWPIYLLLLGFLVALAVAGTSPSHPRFGGLIVKGGGAYSWLHFPGVPGLVQPSEFAKIALVIVLAHWLAWRRERLSTIRECIVPLLLAAVPVLLICMQPDMGTASVFVPLPFILLFLAGLRWRTMLIWGGIGLLLATGGGLYLARADKVPLLRQYHLKRIQVFLVPVTEVVSQGVASVVRPFQPPGVEEVLYGGNTPIGEGESVQSRRKKKGLDSYQIDQAEMALGSGGMFGKGWQKGRLSRWWFLPAHYTDFIYCSLGEQFGFIGCLVLFGLYLLIAWRVVHIAAVTTDYFGKFLVIGLLSVFLLHVFMNIAMTVQFLPVAGLPLPLMSYGGSFLVTNYLLFGLIANVSARR